MESDQKVLEMPDCRHIYHKNCIENWLKLKGRCPMCNSNTRKAFKLERMPEQLAIY